jgi:hypothetical protein
MYLIFVSKCLPNQFGGDRHVPTHCRTPTCTSNLSKKLNSKEVGKNLPALHA